MNICDKHSQLFNQYKEYGLFTTEYRDRELPLYAIHSRLSRTFRLQRDNEFDRILFNEIYKFLEKFYNKFKNIEKAKKDTIRAKKLAEFRLWVKDQKQLFLNECKRLPPEIELYYLIANMDFIDVETGKLSVSLGLNAVPVFFDDFDTFKNISDKIKKSEILNPYFTPETVPEVKLFGVIMPDSDIAAEMIKKGFVYSEDQYVHEIHFWSSDMIFSMGANESTGDQLESLKQLLLDGVESKAILNNKSVEWRIESINDILHDIGRFHKTNAEMFKTAEVDKNYYTKRDYYILVSDIALVTFILLKYHNCIEKYVAKTTINEYKEICQNHLTNTSS